MLPGMLLAIACLTPFLHKAYTIDDSTFLLEARQILKTPFDPWSFPICYSGDMCVLQAGNMGANSREGLMGYLLAPVIFAGGPEWLSHLLQIALVCLAVGEMVRLALRLGFNRMQAAFSGLLIVAIPPMLAMASTAMPDVLALTLGLTGMERLLAWKEERRWPQAAAAGVALGLAPYARPHVVLLLPLGALWLFSELRPRSALEQLRRQAVLWTPILAAALLLLAANFLARTRGGGFERNAEVGTEHILTNLFAYFHYLSFPIPLAGVWFGLHRRRTRFLLIPFAISIVGAYFLNYSTGNLVRSLEVAAVLFGCAAIVDIARTYISKGDRTYILLTLWMLMPLPAALYAHLPIKYLLVVMPAMVLVIIRTLSRLPRSRAILSCGAIVLVTTGYSLILLIADRDFAEYGRRAAAELIAPRVAAGEKVWYSGDWGFYWYAQEAGGRVARPDEPGPLTGELLAVGLMEAGDAALKRFPNRELVDSRSYDSPHGRTMGYGAGLYSNNYGYLLWRWNPAATNKYEIWRVH
jgi:hypothetical protein